MPVIQFLRTAQIEQIEDFPKGCARTVTKGNDPKKAGALHVRPGATREVTEAELKHLQKRKVRLFVIAAKTPPKKPDPKAEETAQEPAGGDGEGSKPDGSGDDGKEPDAAPAADKGSKAAKAAAKAAKSGGK